MASTGIQGADRPGPAGQGGGRGQCLPTSIPSTGGRHLYSSRRGRIGIAGLLVVAGMAACGTAVRGGSPSRFVVAGASGPALLGVAVGDTLPEVAPHRVPPSVVQAADSSA